MAKGNRVRRHPKFFKGLTLGGSIFGLVTTVAFIVIMILNLVGVNPFLTDVLRTYTVRFYNEGAMISEHTYKRGEPIEVPPNPTKEMDELHQNYIFTGWDITGGGLPDIVPTHAYFSFDATATYFGYGNISLSIEDLLKMDIDTLMKIMEALNLDWEQLMDMFNLSPEDLMKLLQKLRVFSYQTREPNSFPSYFRTTSYGDFNYGTKKYIDLTSSYYDPSRISPGSINPLRYTADKLYQAYNLGVGIPEGFGFVDYLITYDITRAPFPAPDCEVETDKNAVTKSDAVTFTQPENGQYQTKATYCPAFRKVINLLSRVGYSDPAITRDQREYYQYALDHYTQVPNEYIETIDNIILEEGFEEEDYYSVDDVGKYVESQANWNLRYNEETNMPEIIKTGNDDPVFGILEHDYASDYDFNSLAIMIFRRLNIPARMVYGYLNIIPDGGTYGEVYAIVPNQHYWCEVYVKDIGWMICDCTNFEALTSENLYGGSFNKEDTPVTDPDDPIDPPEPKTEDEEITYDLSGHVANVGPGDKSETKEIFTFKSDFVGTSYFRSKSYDHYDSSEGWTNNVGESYPYNYQGKNNPLTFSYKVATQLYEPESFTVVNTEDLDYGVAPAYLDALSTKYNDGKLYDSYVGVKVPAKASIKYNSVFIPVTGYDLRKVANKGYENLDATLRENYNNYMNYADYQYGRGTIPYYLEQPINEFVNQYSDRLYSGDMQYDLIQNIKEVIQSEFTYNINFAPYGDGVDPIIGFLNSREGICNNFASLAVMVYRYFNIPARFVTGYGGESKGAGTTNSVTNKNAHAWVEVFVNNIGWVTVDPTGYDAGGGNPEIYGGGFGGDGAGLYEEIIEKTDLEFVIDYPKEEGWITKIYDGQEFESSYARITKGEIDPKHHMEIDDSEFRKMGKNKPGIYRSSGIKITIYDENNVDITNKYYNIKIESPIIEIIEREVEIQIDYDYYHGPLFNGEPISFTEEEAAMYFNCYALSGDGLLDGHTIKFIPDFIIEDGSNYDITGEIIILDSEGKDVTDCYSITISASSVIIQN